jgi:catechol 2,3-dioxygenase-like lactoylglutathione lyase family enzyme
MKFHHVGIRCTDPDAALRFYTEVLGFSVLEDLEIAGARCVFVGNETVRIELEGGGDPMNAGPATVGLTHFAVEVDDIDATAARIAGRGGEFLIPPFQIRPTRKVAFVKAPDGVLIQLIQDFS